jgi:hypothetical protein
MKNDEQERVRFLTHQDKEVLLVDLSNCSAAEVEKLVRIVPVIVTAQPLHSVLILTDFTGASFDDEALRTMKESAVFDKAHVKKSALVGAQSLPHGFYEILRSFSRREFPAFDTREGALDWLTKD